MPEQEPRSSEFDSGDDPLNLEKVDREIHINQMREELNELAGGQMFSGSSGDCPPEVEEKFLEHALAFERAPSCTHLDLLARQGVDLPPPDELDDAALHDKLWEVIRALEKQRTFVYHTDHLSERQLYTHLRDHSLREWTIDLGGNPDAGCGLDLIGSGSDEDIQIDLKYYADEKERQRWAQNFPEDVIPEHVDLPYDRDRLMPRRGWPWDMPHPDADKLEDKESNDE
jgi:hypothetical protein